MVIETDFKSDNEFYEQDFEDAKKGNKDYISKYYNDFCRAEKAVKDLHQLWNWYLLMYKGIQYAVLDSNNNIQIQTVANHRVRLVVNRIQALVQKSIAKARRVSPKYVCVPGNGNYEYQSVCDVATKLIEAKQRESDHKRKRFVKELYCRLYGTAFVRTFWNDEKGMRIPMPTGFVKNPVTGEQEPALEIIGGEVQTKAIGDYDYEVIPPFYIYPDPECENWEDIQWCFVTSFASVDELKWRYAGVKGIEKIKATDSTTKRKLSVNPVSGGIFDEEKMKNTVVVFTGYYKPSFKHPNGKIITFVRDPYIVLEEEPMLENQFPITRFVYQQDGTSVWGMGLVQHLAPIQQEYNKTRSQQIEIKNLMQKPKWAVAKGSGIAQDAITSQPGEIIEYNPTFPPPRIIDPPSLSPIFPMELERSIIDMQDVSYLHDVSQGQLPAGARSGVTVMQLQGQDDEFLSLIIEDDILGWRDVFTRCLYLIDKNYTEERVLNVVGRLKEVATAKFKAGMLEGADWKLQVVETEQTPISPSARLQLMMELIQYGVLDPAKYRNEILKLTGLDLNIDTIPNEETLDTVNAVMENRRCVSGKVEYGKDSMGNPIPYLPIMNFDDHAKHYQQHQKFLKTDEAKAMNEEMREVLYLHIGQHEQAIQESIRSQQELVGGEAENEDIE